MIGDLHGEEGGLITKELHHDYIIIAFFCQIIIASSCINIVLLPTSASMAWHGQGQ